MDKKITKESVKVFIELTLSNGKKTIININSIEGFTFNGVANGTAIIFQSSRKGDSSISVAESYEEVKGLIKEAITKGGIVE